LIKRRIRLDVDQSQGLRADRDADDQKYRHIRNLAFLSDKAGDGSDGQNEPSGKQRLFRNFNGARHFHFFPQAASIAKSGAARFLLQAPVRAMLPDTP
jgi:hypothetical protein